MTKKESTVTTSLRDFVLTEIRMFSQTSAASSYHLILFSCISSFPRILVCLLISCSTRTDKTQKHWYEKLIVHLLMWKCIVSLSPLSILNKHPIPGHQIASLWWIPSVSYPSKSPCRLSDTWQTWNGTLLKFRHKNYSVRFRKHRWGLVSRDVNSGLLD